MRIILIILFFFIAYNGYDGLKGDDNLKKLTMSQLIKEGVGDNRYVEISECYSKGDIVYKYSKESPSNIIEVIFPVMDSTTFYNEIFNEFIETEYGDSSNKTKPSTMLIIKRDQNKFKSNCVSQYSESHTCLIDLVNEDSISSFSIKGTILLGLNDVDKETRNLISSLNYSIPQKVIFLEENSKPRGKFLSILMILGGILGIVIVCYSFFKK